MIIIGSNCVGAKDRNDDARAQGQTQKDVENLLIDAAEMLDRTAPETKATSPSNAPIIYGEPSNLQAYRSGSALPGVRIQDQARDSSYEESEKDSIGDTLTSKKDIEQEEDSIARPYSSRSRALSNKSEEEGKSDGQEEKYDIKGFYSELYTWMAGTKTADETRRKAHEIRGKAQQIREEAKQLTQEKREKAIQTAITMEEYANRLSSTRGNTRKINILRHNLSKNLEE